MNKVAIFVAGFTNKEYFSQDRTKTRTAIEHVSGRMTDGQREEFPSDVAIFAPEVGGDCGTVCITRPCKFLYFDPAIETKTQPEVNALVATEFANLVVRDITEAATDSEREAIAELVEAWTAPQERAAGNAA